MRIFLEKFQFNTVIGILDFEREQEQKVIIDLMAEYNYNGTNFIDYVELKEYIKRSMREEKFGLIEDALIFFKDRLPKEFKIEFLKLKISKPDILSDLNVAVEIEGSC